LIFNELEYAKTMLVKGFIQNKYLTELRILAKYYNKIDELNTEGVKSKLKEFCKKYLPEYNEVIHLDMITKASKYGVQKKNVLTVIPPIHITENELHDIGSLNDLKIEKIAFSALVLSKISKYKSKSKYNNHKEYIIYNFKEMFKYSQERCNQEQKDDILKLLDKSGLFNYTIYGSLKVNFIDEISKPVIILNDFNNFVLEYEKYIGGNVINCKKCGIPFYPANNKNKYCKMCQKDHWKEYNRDKQKEYYNKNKFSV